MARIIFNPGIEIIRGGVGRFVYRRESDGALIVAKCPVVDPNRIPTAAQAQHLQRFKAASARCQRLLEEPGTKQAYQQIVAERGRSKRLRAMVIGDIFKPPTIKTIDLSHYHGAVGNTICILAQDTVGVSRLVLSIYDNTAGLELESAEKEIAPADISPDVEWLYTATVPLPDPSLDHDIDLIVKAYDLAGNETVMSVKAAD